jgi:tRNA(Ile)-lysidine synthase
MMNSLEIRVRKTIRDFGMLSGGEHVLVAVSGGPDSVALLLCLHKLAPHLKLTLTVAHLNHRIRGTEADADEDFVGRLSADLDLPFVSESIDVKQQAETAKKNLEEFARETRYAFLGRTANQVGATRIAVGHTLNDQAETALFRFLRGSGIEGLSGIHPVMSGIVIRPLLECSRDTILDYLRCTGTQYREDSTNSDFRHSRNRIRRELVPYLEKNFNPQLVATLAREALLARETWSLIESQAQELFEDLHSREGESLSLRVTELLNVHPALQKQILRQALRECMGSLRGITSAHIQSLLTLLGTEQSGAQVQLPRGGIGLRQFDAILLSKEAPPRIPPFLYELHIPGRCDVAEAGAVVESAICRTPDLQAIKETVSTHAFLEASTLPRVLTIRSRASGDRYGGLGHRKVKKMLIDARIPMSRRSILPMIVSGTDVIWIPGFRPVPAYAVRPGSPECVVITVNRTC